MAITQKHRDIAVGTPLGDDVLLLQKFTANESLGGMFLFELDLFSDRRQIPAAQIIGKNVNVRVVCAGGNRFFNGYVKDFVIMPSAKQLTEYKAVLVPWLWFLTQSKDCRIFQNMTIPEIIEKVFKDRGMSDFENLLTEQYDKLEYCVQYCESDYNFVTRLMERSGIYYFFKHYDNKHILTLCDSSNPHQQFEKYDVIKYKPFNEREKEETISDWLVTTSVVSNQSALNDFDFKNTRQGLLSKASIPNAGVDGSLEVFDYPGKYLSLAAGEAKANVRMQQLYLPHLTCSGRSFAMGIRPGYKFKMIDCPQTDQNREYLTIESQYTVEAGGFETGQDKKGLQSECKFKVIPSDVQFRMLPITAVPKIDGPQTAIVTGPAGEEIYTDNYGRVKVKFHWDRYGKADENSSCWIRVSQGIAGNKWGMISLPRIGQEVVVEHEEGDPDNPIITGRVYNGQAMPPYPLPEKKTVTTTKTNSSKGGGGYNEIRFEDLKDKEQIFVNAQRDKDENVGRNSYTTVQKDCHDVVKGNLFERFKKDYNEKIYKNHIKQIGQDYNLTVDGSVIEDVKNDQTLLVANKYQISATDIIQETSATISHKTNEHLTEAAMKCSVKAGEICIEGSRAICLKVGGSVVSITPAGVDISGTMVKINSGAVALASKPAVPIVEPDGLLPTKADYSDDGTPGANDRKSPDGSLKPLKVKLKKQKAPDYIPHPNTVVGYVPGGGDESENLIVPTIEESLLPCCIKDLVVKCSHGRSPDLVKRILQVVPTPNAESSLSVPLGKGLFKNVKDGALYQIRDFILANSNSLNTAENIKGTAEHLQMRDKLDVMDDGGKHEQGSSIAFNVKCGYAGKDVVDAMVVGGNKPELCLNSKPHAGEYDWLSKTSDKITILPKKIEGNPLWLKDAKPDIYYIYGRSCNHRQMQYKIESYPNTQTEIGIEISFFEKAVEPVNEALEKFLKRANANGAVGFRVELKGPVGELSYCSGWEEETDWRAFYAVTVRAGLKRVVGLEAEVNVSFLVIGLATLGVPPALGRIIADHIADIYLFVGGGIELSLMGEGKSKVYTDNKMDTVGKVELKSSGEVSIGLGVSVGSEKFMGAEARGSGVVGMEVIGGLVVSEEGIYLDPQVKRKATVLRVTVTGRVWKVELDIYSGEWELFKEATIYPASQGTESRIWLTKV